MSLLSSTDVKLQFSPLMTVVVPKKCLNQTQAFNPFSLRIRRSHQDRIFATILELRRQAHIYLSIIPTVESSCSIYLRVETISLIFFPSNKLVTSRLYTLSPVYLIPHFCVKSRTRTIPHRRRPPWHPPCWYLLLASAPEQQHLRPRLLRRCQ